jgi:uncharacterized protein YbcV (DUF1398 family)
LNANETKENSMDESAIAAAERCLRGAEDNTMTFPQAVGALIEAGFEGYAVDFRRATATYYRPDGDSAVLSTHRVAGPVAASFDPEPIKAAIREAQVLAPGYNYRDFCRKVAAAGCAGYMVSFSGRRALYYGRTAETHVEHFPR